ncbi:DUF1254 domain-containing protein [Streptomyces sp. BE133]|uniref:DUF1254 domain-containing protein n=1 Tax=Streptomyces sp. BE133 TaxID=3002523 RepID=UPI002E7902ED|nr:DUF1254 domain-containing protein [Streptomyces sp. BE133]MEE1806914.1 DUF1254 domain-containing protein [Streptomyces sp. BE133]
MSPSPSDQSTLSTTTDAYVFGYPLVLSDITRAAQTNTVKAGDEAAPVNQFCHHTKLPDPDSKVVVRLNLDTLYSQAWLDLTTEPLVLSVPVMNDDPAHPRYWLMQILDFWTNTVQDPSSLTPLIAPLTDPDGTRFHNYLLTGPGWQGTVPEGVIQLAVPTATLWIIGRTEIRDSTQAELDTVNGYQKQMRLLPLSLWPDPDNTYVPPDGTYDPDLPTDAPVDQITAMDGPTFFDRLATLLATTPLSPADAAMTAKLAAIGLLPGSTQPLPDTTALNQAVTDGQSAIAHQPQPDPVNGWNLTTTGIGTYGTDYGQRGYIALTALGANLPHDALYPSNGAGSVDTQGNLLRYTLTFPAGQTPPVDAFWSLTAYDAQGFLIPNGPDGDPDTDDGIYSIGHRTPTPTPNDDGSVTLHLQYENPGDTVPTGNWLPINNSTDGFTLMLRLYAPKTDQITPQGVWAPPGLKPVTTTA